MERGGPARDGGDDPAPQAACGERLVDRAAGVRVIDTSTGAVVRTLPTEGLVFPVHPTSTGLVLAGELRVTAGGSALGAQVPGLLHVYEGFEERARL
ncbi:hypothetical protein [Streptomyces sp. NPDC003036]|uniref:hypothetical protein n=1 Tax=Streptomyces sp. NPDC003036 TaxID=3154442 RepID=UPI0033BF44DA